jgi:coniferyl-aldehyde dehydrogenase
VGEAFSGLPFDHLLFTGSTEWASRSTRRRRRTSLLSLWNWGQISGRGLPGLSAGQGARSIAFGKFVNAGQTCIAPDTCSSTRAASEAFAEQVMSEARRSYPKIAGQPGLFGGDQRSAISNGSSGRSQDARAAGAKVLTHEDEGAREERKIGPTVILGARRRRSS